MIHYLSRGLPTQAIRAQVVHVPQILFPPLLMTPRIAPSQIQSVLKAHARLAISNAVFAGVARVDTTPVLMTPVLRAQAWATKIGTRSIIVIKNH